MLCFRRDIVLASKTAKVKIWHRTTKTIKNTVEIRVIPLILVSLNIWSCNIQNWEMEGTKVCTEASIAEYKPNPPTLKGKEATFCWRSPKKGLPTTTMSSTARHKSLSNNIVGSPMWIGWHVLRLEKQLGDTHVWLKWKKFTLWTP